MRATISSELEKIELENEPFSPRAATTTIEKKEPFLATVPADSEKTPVVEAKQQQQPTTTPKRKRMKSLSMKKLSLGMGTGTSTKKVTSPTPTKASKKTQKSAPSATTKKAVTVNSPTTPTKSNSKPSRSSKSKYSLGGFMRKKQSSEKDQIVPSDRLIEVSMAEQKLSNDQKKVQEALAKAQEEADSPSRTHLKLSNEKTQEVSKASSDEQKLDVSANASVKSASSNGESTLKSVEVQLMKEITDDIITSSPPKDSVEAGKEDDDDKKTVASDQSTSNNSASKVFDTVANVELSHAATNDEDEMKGKVATRDDDTSSPTLENITKSLKEAFGMFDKASETVTTGPDNKPEDSKPEDDKPEDTKPDDKQTEIKEVSKSKDDSPVATEETNDPASEETDAKAGSGGEEVTMTDHNTTETGSVSKEVEVDVDVKTVTDDKEETPVELSQPEVDTQEPAKVEPELPSNVDVEPLPHEPPKEDVCPEPPDKTEEGVELSAKFDEHCKGGSETCVKSAKVSI